LLLKNRINVVRDGVSMLLIGAAIAISSDMFGNNSKSTSIVESS
jgi:hypothetical protein